MPNRFYAIERPFKERKPPKVLSKEEILKSFIPPKTLNINAFLVYSIQLVYGGKNS